MDIEKKNRRQERLDTLRAIISTQEMSSQADMLEALAAAGFHLTQATLSRDLKMMKVERKVTMEGGYVYGLPNITKYKRTCTPTQLSVLKRIAGFVSIQFSGNVCVMKTKPGYAGRIAYNIDNSDIPYILGTIAGDDTILIVMSENSSERDIVNALAKMPE